jgi:hypothetical protein
LEELKGKGHKIDIKQGPNEKKAQAYLDAFLMMQLAAEDEKELITKAKKAIGKGKFQHLQRDINKLEKNTKQAPMKPVALLEALITILKSYPLNQLDEQELAQNGTNPSLLAQFLNPDIIISESFSL